MNENNSSAHKGVHENIAKIVTATIDQTEVNQLIAA